MRLQSIQCVQYRRFDDVELNLGRRLTLLLGANGSGKSSVLNGLAVGFGAVHQLLKVKSVNFKKTDFRVEGSAQSKWVHVKLTDANGLVWGRTERDSARSVVPKDLPKLAALKSHLTPFLEDDFAQDLPLLVHYGVKRMVLDMPQRRRNSAELGDRFTAMDNALTAGSSYRPMARWFDLRDTQELRAKRERDEAVEFNDLRAVRAAVSEVLPEVERVFISSLSPKLMVAYKNQILALEQLSDGYQTLLALVMDLAYRLSVANPHRSNPLEAEAVVLIDEVDLHLHPAWQGRVVEDLLRAFPNVQFVLTTHSPVVVESINNHLQRHRIEGMPLPEELDSLFSLDPADLAVYQLNDGKVERAVDPETGLLDNALLDRYDTLNRDFSAMLDLQYGDHAAS